MSSSNALTIVTAMGYPSDMTYRRLGDSGLVVSAVGLGTNNFGMKLGMEECREVVDAAIDNGITLFDTSDSYGPSEERLGALLEGRRDDVIIATKFGSDVRQRGLSNGVDWGARGSRRYIRRAVESSLTRLRTDWIDLYQMHKPDPGTPIEETLSALSDLVHEGKVRYLGNSNFAAWQITEAEWTARTSGRDRFIAPRTSTTCSNATRSASWFQRWCATASVYFRSIRWPTGCSPGNTTGASRRLPAAESSPGASKGCSLT